VLQTVVEEKQTKMRDTLKLMGVSSKSYGLSVVLFQGFFAFVNALILSLFTTKYFLYTDWNRWHGLALAFAIFLFNLG